MKYLKSNVLIITFIVFNLSLKSQVLCDTLPFILCGQNEILFNSSDSNLVKLKRKVQGLNTNKSDKINIVHIGDSHLQAGFLTEKIRQSLFKYYCPNDTFAAPGFIFPYTIAQTNNPYFYKINYTGKWEYSKNIDSEKTSSLGLSGITVRTKNAKVAFGIKMLNKKEHLQVKYYFDKVKILHNTDTSIHISVNGKIAKTGNGFSYLTLDRLTDSITISIINNDTNKYFELYGIMLEEDGRKINYHTIGVNGATAQSYLKCDYFSDQLKSIKPDLIILSLGTNEAYDNNFLQLKHEFELKDLIYQIEDVVPEAMIILTTPNDHLKNRKFTNNNVPKVRENIYKISERFSLSVWDLYTIMGGENSIQKWYKKGLTGEDNLHFKKQGYEIQGELFSKALIKLFEKNNTNFITGVAP